MPSFAFLDGAPLAFAHRGGAGEAPENTMPAFAAAVALGYRHLETDVHLTRDGVLLAFHDDALDRVTDGTGIIAELTYDEVSQARVDGREPIPRFEDLLGAWPDVYINIDPKHDRCVEALADVIRQAGAVSRVCIGSFSDRRISRLRRMLGPQLCTSMGPVAVARLRSASFGVPTGRISGPCAQVPASTKGHALVDERFVQTAHRRGVQVHVWTIDDADEMERLFDLGVDGIMTDRPAVLKDVMTRRGIWTGR